MEGMSNACEYTGICNALFNTPDDHAQVAVWGVDGTNYVTVQWAYCSLAGNRKIPVFYDSLLTSVTQDRAQISKNKAHCRFIMIKSRLKSWWTKKKKNSQFA